MVLHLPGLGLEVPVTRRDGTLTGGVFRPQRGDPVHAAWAVRVERLAGRFAVMDGQVVSRPGRVRFAVATVGGDAWDVVTAVVRFNPAD